MRERQLDAHLSYWLKVNKTRTLSYSLVIMARSESGTVLPLIRDKSGEPEMSCSGPINERLQLLRSDK